MHDPSYAFMILTFLHVHAIGATKEITVLEYEADPQEEHQEV